MRSLSLALLPLALLAGCIEVAWPPGPVMPTAEPQAGFPQAVEAFRDGRRAAAYGRFARLADAGHVPSAQIALVMLRHGDALFGSDWSATPAQQQRWTALVVNAARQRLDAQEYDRGD
jgi:hypothetical protein